MILMVEEGIRGRICHSIYQYAKANNEYVKNHNRNKESLYIQYWDVNNLNGWAMLQDLPAKHFEWIKKILFNLVKTSQKTIRKKVMKDVFL